MNAIRSGAYRLSCAFRQLLIEFLTSMNVAKSEVRHAAKPQPLSSCCTSSFWSTRSRGMSKARRRKIRCSWTCSSTLVSCRTCERGGAILHSWNNARYLYQSMCMGGQNADDAMVMYIIVCLSLGPSVCAQVLANEAYSLQISLIVAGNVHREERANRSQ